MITKRSLLFEAFNVIDRFSWLKARFRSKDDANILAFHRVNDRDSDSLTTSTAAFREMMCVLKERYRVVALQDLVRAIKAGRKIDAKTVVVTFDDGYRDNSELAAPILKELQIPATFFVTTGYINTKKTFPWDVENLNPFPLMTWDEVRELDAMGFEIGAHSVNHSDLGAISPEEARREVRESKQHIESELGRPVLSFAFPFGKREHCTSAVSQIVKEEGYHCCCNAYGGKATENSDLFSLYRIPAYQTSIEMRMELDNFVTYFDGKTRIAGLAWPVV